MPTDPIELGRQETEALLAISHTIEVVRLSLPAESEIRESLGNWAGVLARTAQGRRAGRTLTLVPAGGGV